MALASCAASVARAEMAAHGSGAPGRASFGIRHLLFLGLVVLAAIALGPTVHAATPANPAPAWVQVSVATVWNRPSSPRPIDEGALRDPARIEGWLASLSVAERLGFDSRINTQVLLGDEVLVTAQRRGWSRVEVPEQRGSKYPDGIVGWVPSVQLSLVAPSQGSREAIVGVPRTWLHAVTDGAVGQRRFLVSYDTELPVIGSLAGYLILALPGGGEGAIADGALDRVPDGTVSTASVAAGASQFLGLSYLWGGTSGFGYDCSGLVYALFARYGLYLPRDAADQQHAGTPVSLDDLLPGDLLFFAGPGGKGAATHVAIYVGGGRVIDSPQTGASVEMVPMASLPVWDDFSGAIRVAGTA